MRKTRIRWSDLRYPKIACDVDVMNIGLVGVTDENIKTRESLSNPDPEVELVAVDAAQDPVPTWRIRRIIP